MPTLGIGSVNPPQNKPAPPDKTGRRPDFMLSSCPADHSVSHKSNRSYEKYNGSTYRSFTRSRLSLLAVCLIGAQSSLIAQRAVHYNREELRQLKERAKTADDYRLLASYIRNEESVYRAKAHSDNEMYERALRNRSALALPEPP